MDISERLHHEWLGMAQPEGLVVTASALKAAEANITWPVTELQAMVADLAGEKNRIADLRGFLREVLDWSDDFLVAGTEMPAGLRVRLEGGESLAPTFALRSIDEAAGEGGAAGEPGTIANPPQTFVFLVEETQRAELDAAVDDKRWSATAHQRFERLLRETGVLAGLLTNGREFRLVVAPKGESAGWVTFRLAEMLSVDGRPLLGAFHMLLNERRILSLAEGKRLGGLLRASREYQNTVSNKLREQILGALRDLLGGFQHADRMAEERILGPYRHGHLDEVYSGLVTVLMRMVFVLYAEERSLLPMESDLYASSYSMSRLYAQLQEDWNKYGETINDRFGAWGRVITLFRLLHDGVRAAGGLLLPPRKGSFFDPDAFAFLEGRGREAGGRQAGQTLELPRVSDGVVYRVLDRLLRLDGERLQYKGLDVEQIGSVYEGLMGFEIEVAAGDSLCLTPEHVVVNLDALVKLGGAERLKELKAQAGLDLKDKTAGEVKEAKTAEALQAALARRNSPRQPGLLVRGTLYIQPGEERRKTGSHYTPRTLTQPIVETTLRPILERLGPEVTPAQILDLKICDPAMGSGAFLVEACRQLADVLVKAWRRTESMPELPRDEEPVLHARRLIAQRCIYGVDKNPLAVDLARLSLWLVTFAREHPFTFVDHSLRNGDSLVGLSRDQIFNLSFDPKKGHKLSEQARNQLFNAVRKAEGLRAEIHAIGDPPDNDKLDQLWDEASEALNVVRTVGDAMVATYFEGDSDKARKVGLERLVEKVPAWLQTGVYGAEIAGMVSGLREGPKPVPAFHWEVEFPEVFGRENGGFDAFVGNPPFAGKNALFASSGEAYVYFLLELFEGTHGSADFVVYFFRRAFASLRRLGTLGLVATNTISQGDTRTAGLYWICLHGGQVYYALRRLPWPGLAAVVVSVICVQKDGRPNRIELDHQEVNAISAYLSRGGVHGKPDGLASNKGVAFLGSVVLGMGFTFDDSNPSATPLHEMRRILESDPTSIERVFPYLGGEDINTSPRLEGVRYVINFADMSEADARRWPELFTIVEQKVRPERQKLGNNGDARRRKTYWWRWGQYAHALFAALEAQSEVLVASRVSQHLAFVRQPTTRVFSDRLVVIASSSNNLFSILQSRIHEAWARFFSSTLEDRLNYAPSDCFETFPFAPAYESNPSLEAIGREYYEFRAALMIRNNEGLTKTYNRFHNPDETSADIRKLRDLHAAMDRAVLDAYGWSDIHPVYDFRPQLDESIRFTWAEDTRDEVLARLLELNRVMAAKEAEDAARAESVKPPKKGAAKKRGKKDEGTLELPLGAPATAGSPPAEKSE